MLEKDNVLAIVTNDDNCLPFDQCCGSGSESGSGSISQRYGSGSFYHHANIVRKTLIPANFVTLFDFLSLKNDVNVPPKSNKQKNF
jgi:hypothetical protein